ALAREWSRAGHDVTIVCQERHPERYDLGGARVVVPELPERLLPVFVLDRYEGLDAQLLQDFSVRERRRYVEAHVAALPEPGRDAALAGLLDEARRDPPNPGNANERLPDERNAERFASFLGGEEPTVVYFGKLIENKGVQLLLEALKELDARAVIVGFGDYRA